MARRASHASRRHSPNSHGRGRVRRRPRSRACRSPRVAARRVIHTDAERSPAWPAFPRLVRCKLASHATPYGVRRQGSEWLELSLEVDAMRERRVPLTRDRVLAAAVELADEGGI